MLFRSLGTGGLVRAYTRAVKEGLKNCTFGRMRYGWDIRITTDYNGIGKIQYLLGNAGIEPVSAEYAEQVTLRVTAAAEDARRLEKEITEATAGRAGFEKLQELYFVDREQGEV